MSADLNDILVFVRVVETGSFTGAARALALPKSTVSRRITALETRLNARLLQRTTRQVSLTEAGQTYFGYATRVVAEIEEAERALGSMQSTPAGPLRVTMPLSFGFLGGVLAGYLRAYPMVELDVVCTDRVVDLVEERFDVAVRAGALGDSRLIARSLGRSPGYVVAAPAWWKSHGVHEEPLALSGLPWLHHGVGHAQPQVRLYDGREEAAFAIRPRLAVNDLDILCQGALEGLGLAILPAFYCAPHLEQGRLVRVAPRWSGRETPIHAVFPSTRHVPAKVRHFVEHLKQHMPLSAVPGMYRDREGDA